MNKLHTTLDRLDRELQDLKERLYSKPACIYHAYRDYTVSFSIACLEAMPKPSLEYQGRIELLLSEFRAIGYAWTFVIMIIFRVIDLAYIVFP